MRKICCGPVFNFKDVTANLAIYVDSTAPNLTIRSQTKSIGFITLIGGNMPDDNDARSEPEPIMGPVPIVLIF